MLRSSIAGALALAVMLLAAPIPAMALHIPMPTKCFCFSGLGGHLMKRNGRDCNDVCNYVDKKKKVSLTDVSASRRLRPHRPRNRLHHDGEGGRRFAGHRSRARGGAQATAGVGVAEGDHDGRMVVAHGGSVSDVHRDHRSARGSVGEIVAHPSGCPRTQFCGCGVAVHIFGAPIRALWLASNWFKFPAASPAPGMVAVRNHHVFAIEQVLGNGLVLAYDPNSGRHLTRVHVASLRGYRVVNPRGG